MVRSARRFTAAGPDEDGDAVYGGDRPTARHEER